MLGLPSLNLFVFVRSEFFLFSFFSFSVFHSTTVYLLYFLKMFYFDNKLLLNGTSDITQRHRENVTSEKTLDKSVL